MSLIDGVGELKTGPDSPEWPVVEDGLEVIDSIRVTRDWVKSDGTPIDVVAYDYAGETLCQVGFYANQRRVSIRYGDYPIGRYMFSYDERSVFLLETQGSGVPDYDREDIPAIAFSEVGGIFEKPYDKQIINGLASFIQEVIPAVRTMKDETFDPEPYAPLFERLDLWTEALSRSVVHSQETQLIGETVIDTVFFDDDEDAPKRKILSKFILGRRR